MTRLSSIFLLFVPLAGACAGRVQMSWHPNVVSDVPDSTMVRFSTPESRKKIFGMSAGWQRGTPALVSIMGDTVMIPQNATMEVFRDHKGNLAVWGGIIGYLIGTVHTIATCPPERDLGVCGESGEAALSLLAGGLIGWAIKTERWIRVARDTLPAPRGNR